jgi:hypothetical protein
MLYHSADIGRVLLNCELFRAFEDEPFGGNVFDRQHIQMVFPQNVFSYAL